MYSRGAQSCEARRHARAHTLAHMTMKACMHASMHAREHASTNTFATSCTDASTHGLVDPHITCFCSNYKPHTKSVLVTDTFT